MIFSHHQISEKQIQKPHIGFNLFSHISIIRTNQRIAEVPRVVGKQIIVHPKTDATSKASGKSGYQPIYLNE